MITPRLFSLALCLIGLFTPKAWAGPQFKETPILLTVVAGQNINFDLRTKLVDPTVSVTSWDISTDKPAWLSLNKTSGFLTGVPTQADLGVKNFKLSAFSGEGADFNHATKLTVITAPVFTQNPLDLGTQAQDQAFAFDLNNHVNNASGGGVTYSATGLPSWLKLSSNGILSGTPKRPDVGNYTGIQFTVTSNDTSLSSTVNAFGKVNITLYPPSWNTNPLFLADAFEDSLYSQDVSSNVTNPEGGPLSYALVNPPNWVQINSNGVISGTPGQAAVGNVNLTVHLSSVVNGIVLDGGDLSVRFNVIHVNHAPVLSQPIHFTILGETLANLDLSPYASDSDGDKITFEKLSGPNWVGISSNGMLTGTPEISDEGINNFSVRISDGQGGISTGNVKVTVTHKNHPPVINSQALTFTVKEREVQTRKLKDFISDLEKDALTFQLISAPAFATLTNDGVLTLKPQFADIGTHSLNFEVSDGQLATSGIVTIKVERDPRAPVWLQNPISYNATTSQVFSKNVASLAKDLDGLPLTFAKVSGPNWLTVAADGSLTGTPSENLLGENHFVVSVKNDLLSANADININVVTPPNWGNGPLDLGTQKQDQPFSLDLNTLISNPSGGALTFSFSGQHPAWMSLNPNGTLSGTPKRADVGAYTGVPIVATSASTGLSATALAFGKVVITLYAPSWKVDPVVLSDAFEDSFYLKDLLSYVQNPEGGPLSFELLNPPAWIQLTPNGSLSGTPGKNEVGNVVLTAHVTSLVDGTLLEGGTASIQFKVIHVNHAPTLVQPLVFTVEGETLAQIDISSFASDSDGDPLTFEKVSGPAWAQVSSTGLISGTPQIPDEGANTFSVRVNDGMGGKTVGTVVVNVTHKNHPPIINSQSLFYTVKERETRVEDLKKAVVDPEGDTLTFTLVDTLPWVSLTPTGLLTLKPLFANIGEVSVAIEVHDGKLAVSGTIHIKVVRDPRAPVWNENPIRYNAKLLVPFSDSLFGKAKDLDGFEISYEKVSGPSWLTVASNGDLSGTPPDTAIGENKFVVSVKNDLKSANADLIITVVDPNQPPVVNSQALNFTVKEREVQTQNLNQFVTDPDGDVLTFTLVDNYAWLSLSSTGSLEMKPLFKDIGEYSVRVNIKDVRATVTAIVKIKVVRDPRPPVWLENPVHFNALLNRKFTETLSSKAKDLDGYALTFAKVSGPDWLIVSANGAISGTPRVGTLGENSFVVSVKNDLLSASADLIITVTDPNLPPYWTADPIELTGGQVNKSYMQRVDSFAKDPDVSDTLTFSKVSGPDWALVTTSGLIIGTPTVNDIGYNSFVIRATDPWGAFADTHADIQVNDPNTPPRWTQDPIPLGEITAETAYAFDLSKFAVDDDGDLLTFKKIYGPNWLSISNEGMLSGTPAKSDLGEFIAIFETSDGRAQVQVGTSGKVVKKLDPNPVITPNSLVFSVKEREVFTENLNQPKYVTDPAGKALTFTLKESASWVKLTVEGGLTLSPLFAHIGDHTFTLKVTNADGFSTEGPLVVHVLRNPRPPTWLQNPIVFTATVAKPFAATVSDKVKDSDNLPLSFAKTSGATWLSVSNTGNLNGTPALSDLGANSFTVQAMNDVLPAEVTVIINVVNAAPTTDTIDIAEPVLGAKVENLWVMDGTPHNSTLNKGLVETIPDYFRDLKNAGVVSAGLFISTDPKYKTMPVPGSDGSLLMNGDNPNISDDWKYRSKAIVPGFFSNSMQSVIWSMFLLQNKLPSLPVYHNGYVMPQVPMEVAFATSSADNYCMFAKNTPQASWKTIDYANEFKRFYAAEDKALRISGMLGKFCGQDCCHNGYNGVQEKKGRETTHDEFLTQYTNGLFRSVKGKNDVREFMADYTKSVIFRAYVSAKNRIKLSKVPHDPSKISVTLAGSPLAGNTGSATDKWFYDADRNEIVVFWSLIDLSKLKVGDTLVIHYQASM